MVIKPPKKMSADTKKYYIYMIGEDDNALLRFEDCGGKVDQMATFINHLPDDQLDRFKFRGDGDEDDEVDVFVLKGPFETEREANLYYEGYYDAMSAYDYKFYHHRDIIVVGLDRDPYKNNPNKRQKI